MTSQILSKVDIYNNFFGTKLYDNGSDNPQESLYFSVLDWDSKIWMIIKSNDKVSYHPYYDRHRNLYDYLNVGDSVMYDSEGGVVYPMGTLLDRAEKMGLNIEIYIWKRSLLDRFLGNWYKRDPDYIYKS